MDNPFNVAQEQHISFYRKSVKILVHQLDDIVSSGVFFEACDCCRDQFMAFPDNYANNIVTFQAVLKFDQHILFIVLNLTCGYLKWHSVQFKETPLNPSFPQRFCGCK
jgi:hypothetical protein